MRDTCTIRFEANFQQMLISIIKTNRLKNDLSSFFYFEQNFNPTLKNDFFQFSEYSFEQNPK